ncbi:uncharacterized protein LOC132730247 [Ruditapes philippinarum]|uniref:uncharacterized protein LOC132730247 n=1 Tax=Ruditapes philippinarum TaxID=129788 RepID=UPI00295C3546|nr:uncharacterized protein LOC132730247 [Ruditapes philippinarum]
MNPLPVPEKLHNLTIIEQQLICRIVPYIQIHMLKHGGIAAYGHCIAFPQNVNEPAKILPNLPKDINIIRVRRSGSNDTTKEFNVRRSVVENSLRWLKANNPAYKDIIISTSRLNMLPNDAEINVDTIETMNVFNNPDKGPAQQQADPGEIDGHTISSITLPDNNLNIQAEIEMAVREAVDDDNVKVKRGKKYVSIPWPTQSDTPLSEFTTKYFFTLAFPCLFPFGVGDFHINRPRTCKSMTDWAEHLMWFEDGRFAKHQYFKFIVHNIIMRKRTLEQSTFIVKQQLGENPISINDIKEKLNSGDTSIVSKMLYFGASLRGTSQYWAQRNKELKSLIKFQINEKNGLPSFFTTASCAEYHFKTLRRILHDYTLETSGTDLDLTNRNNLFQVLQQNTHIVSLYFDLRTKAYFDLVMCPAFGVDAYWYRYEFAKSRGMIHWHGLCWRSDREPHNLLHSAYSKGLSEDLCAEQLSNWAKDCLAMTASHPAGQDDKGCPRKDLWAPPEGTAEPPAEEHNPSLKLLMDTSESQESLLEDYLHLCNRINIHSCSDYCLRKKGQDRVCRMEFGSERMPGKALRDKTSYC